MVQGLQVGTHGMDFGQAAGKPLPENLDPAGHQEGIGQGQSAKNGKQPVPPVAFGIKEIVLKSRQGAHWEFRWAFLLKLQKTKFCILPEGVR